MKKLFTFLGLAMATFSHSQTNLYTENFNTGGGTWTLNTSDMSSNPSSTLNTFLVNSSYAGGSGSLVCMSFPFSFTIPNTPAQPGGIVGSPNSGYMHINSLDAAGFGITNACFRPADGFCAFAENNFVKMNTDVNTVGLDTVKLSFWWMGNGASTNYAELYYSTNGGTAWTLVTTPISQYYAQANWVQQTVTIPAFVGHATLRFGFRFVNGTATAAADPGFGVDDVIITGITNTGGPTITTTPINGSYCAGDSIAVSYTISGTFTGGNIFTAQLSDGAGSFASPVAIGTLNSTSAGTINCLLPPGSTTASGYQIRVVSSTPSVIGSQSGAFTINALPSGTASNGGPYCEGDTIALTSSGGATYAWSGPLSFTSTSQNPTITGSTVSNTGTYSVTVTDGNGCSTQTTTTVTVQVCGSGIEDLYFENVYLYPNPATEFINIQLDPAMVDQSLITMMDMLGKVVYTTTPSQSLISINRDALNLESGIYLVRIKYLQANKTFKVIIK